MARKPRHLSPEERALWDKVAGTADPMHPTRPATDPITTPKAPPRPVAPKPQPKLEIPARLPGRSAPQTAIDLAPSPGQGLAAQPLAMDRKAFRRMRGGKLKPEGRIDLHGMTLAQAEPALIRFILSSQAAGKRLVLVISGKGQGSRDEGPIPYRRGALRREVPMSLGRPPCAAAVLQVATAHQSHGGDGAYYVYLRRAR